MRIARTVSASGRDVGGELGKKITREEEERKRAASDSRQRGTGDVSDQG
jgi:hypothetical protein